MKKRLYLLFALLAISALLLAACQPSVEPVAEEPTEEPVEEEHDMDAMEEGDMMDIGTEDNPIIWALVPSQDTDAVIAGAEQIAAAIEEATGYVITPVVTTDYTAAVEAMCNGEAHMGALNTFNYVLASARGCADVQLASQRFGSTFYAGQIITRPDTGIESVADLAGHTFCRPDPTSTSGWIIPSIAMQAEGINPDTDLTEIVDAGGHDGVVIAVYNGDCDAGSTFVDARGNVEEEFPDVREAVIVVAESAPIPNDTISFSPDLPADVVEAITNALLALNDTEDGQALLNTLYSWEALVATDDTFYDGFRQQLDAAGMSIEDLL
ncbi:MAG: phosphate/phosphite/phosphonate ABC transporter substrate-binding protein [Chloroflexi bacterium]|nr:phosphate/phosphite/phosphonate ABC transporter substrate-binding protein [Chloroflexota bacterium]